MENWKKRFIGIWISNQTSETISIQENSLGSIKLTLIDTYDGEKPEYNWEFDDDGIIIMSHYKKTDWKTITKLVLTDNNNMKSYLTNPEGRLILYYKRK